MWNRVLLLIAGVACGWNLVGWLTLPGALKRSRLVYLAVAGAFGVGYSALLGVQTGAWGPALVVFGIGALVAYAGAARQASGVEEPLPRPLPRVPADRDDRPLVLLALDGEPEAYDGPGAWAQHFALRGAEGVAVPHWLVRPVVYARIRRAYRGLRPEDTVRRWAARLAARLDEVMGGGCRACEAFLLTAPTVSSALLHAAEGGAVTILLVPVGQRRPTADALREQVNRSRVREAGVSVEYLPAPDGLAPVADALAERLGMLSRGFTPPSLEPLVEGAVESLLGAVRTRQGEAARTGGDGDTSADR